MVLLENYIQPETASAMELLALQFAAWNVLNFIVMALPIQDSHLARKDRLDMRNRITSCVHGIIVMFLSGYNYFFLQSECGATNSSFEQNILIFSTSYFLYDMISMAYLGILDASMTIHHFICIYGMSIGIIEQRSANILVACLYLSEISNPSMHVRMVLKHLGKRYTKAYELAEISYILLYMYGRVFLGVSVLIRTLGCPTNPLIVKFLGCSLLAQSLFFIYRMVFILKQRSAEYSERKRKGVKMQWFQGLSKEDIAKIDRYNSKNKPKMP